MGSPAEAAHAAQRGLLAKTDLTTDMVFEFTELQGTIGGIYAREEGLPEQVWKAIYYQYLPIGVEADAPPSREQLGAAAVTWAAVSLADKLDTFVSLSRAGERATGSRDPFGLRRQTQGAVRILMDLPELTGIDREVWLGPILARAASQGSDCSGLERRDRGGRAGLCGRARALRAGAARVRAARSSVLRRPGGDVSPLRARRIAEALQGMRASEDFQALAVLFKRVKNIAKELQQRRATRPRRVPEPAERALLEALDLAARASRPRPRAATIAPPSSKSPAFARPSTGSSPRCS